MSDRTSPSGRHCTVCCRKNSIRVRYAYVKMQLQSWKNFLVSPITKSTWHRASTSTYSLTFRVRVTTPPQYGRNGTAHAAGASILSPEKGVFAGMRSVRVRHACGGPGRLPLGCATHFHSVAIATQPVHRLQIRPMVHN